MANIISWSVVCAICQFSLYIPYLMSTFDIAIPEKIAAIAKPNIIKIGINKCINQNIFIIIFIHILIYIFFNIFFALFAMFLYVFLE